MEENKVILDLKEYDRLKSLEYLNETIVDYLLSYAEIENGNLKVDYNIRYSKFIERIVKEKYPKKYEARCEELKKEEE